MRRRPDSRWHWRPDQSLGCGPRPSAHSHVPIPRGSAQWEPHSFRQYPRAPSRLTGWAHPVHPRTSAHGYPDASYLNQRKGRYRKGRPVVTEERQRHREAMGAPGGEALTPAPDLGRRHGLPRRRRLYPERFMLPRHRRGPVSRHGADPGHCRRGQAQQRSHPQ